MHIHVYMYTSIYDSINMIYYKFYIYRCYKNLTVVWGKSLSRSGSDIKLMTLV